jgi:putative ABC transport system ATP-binding protein
MTAIQNVELPMVFKGFSPEKRIERARKLLEDVGLGERINSLPSKLSGGEAQRVAIARALANDPLIVFADEPTGNLDSETGKSIIEIFKSLNKNNNKTIVLITHDINVGKQTEKIFNISDGKIKGEKE